MAKKSQAPVPTVRIRGEGSAVAEQDTNLWLQLKLAYLSGDQTLKELMLNDERFYSLSYKKAWELGKTENWFKQREDFQFELEKRAKDVILQREKDKVAARTLKSLKSTRMIQKLAYHQLKAWLKKAKGMPIMDAKDAAKMMEMAIKLERLIFGESTQSIQVKEVHVVIEAVTQIIATFVPEEKLEEAITELRKLMPADISTPVEKMKLITQHATEAEKQAS